MEFTIETGVAVPVTAKKGNGVKAYITLFLSYKATLVSLIAGQSFMLPITGSKKLGTLRDATYMLNKFGKLHGAKYVASNEPNGVRIHCVATGTPKEPVEVSAAQQKGLNTAFAPYVVSVKAPLEEEIVTPAIKPLEEEEPEEEDEDGLIDATSTGM